jgi:folate-binding protein YgfZ
MNQPDAYRTLVEGCGLVDLGHRTQVELTGEDRAAFLHNLCTNEVRRLPAGSGCEAFLTNAQGKILFHVYIFARADSLVIETVPDAGQRLLAHLDRYLIRERVALHDRSQDWAELLVAGTQAERLLLSLGASVPAGHMEHTAARVEPAEIQLRRVDWIEPPAWLIGASRPCLPELHAALVAAGATPSDLQVFDTLRIEAGTPLYGRDISDDNLPQELARDERAISFTKGCYIGQETVARIDALGHVNKTLVGVRFGQGEVPAVDTPLEVHNQAVGRVTSATFSPRLGAPLALAYVRRGHNTPGTRLDSPAGPAEVIRLPV